MAVRRNERSARHDGVSNFYLQNNTGLYEYRNTRNATKEISSQLVIIMTDICTKFTDTLPGSTANATTVDCVFLEHRVTNYVILYKLPVKIITQLLSKFFPAISNNLKVNNINTAGHYWLNNGQAEHFNSTPIILLRHYV